MSCGKKVKSHKKMMIIKKIYFIGIIKRRMEIINKINRLVRQKSRPELIELCKTQSIEAQGTKHDMASRLIKKEFPHAFEQFQKTIGDFGCQSEKIFTKTLKNTTPNNTSNNITTNTTSTDIKVSSRVYTLVKDCHKDKKIIIETCPFQVDWVWCPSLNLLFEEKKVIGRWDETTKSCCSLQPEDVEECRKYKFELHPKIISQVEEKLQSVAPKDYEKRNEFLQTFYEEDDDHENETSDMIGIDIDE